MSLYVNLYTILIMSLLSFLGSTFTTTNAISKIYRRPEFAKFLNNVNDKPTQQVIHKFFKNLIMSIVDDIFRESPEIDNSPS